MKKTALSLLMLLFALSVWAAPARMDTYDLSYLSRALDGSREALIDAWDEMHLLVAMQGIANREEPKLYFLYKGNNGSLDQFWLDKMREDGAWLHKTRVNGISGFSALYEKYGSVFKGAVVYDPNVPATSCVASTIAGVEDLAPIRYDTRKGSLYDRMVVSEDGPQLPVKRWLLNSDGTSMFTGKGKIPGTDRDSTGSAKCDAYIWAKINYLDKGLCSREYMGYYIDYYFALNNDPNTLNLATLVNQDFQIMHKAFVFDLGVWDDEAVIDDPDQRPGLDMETFQELLLSQYTQAKGEMVQISGFTPWNMKYTKTAGAMGQHGDVDTEWRHAELLSNYNCYMDADAIGYSDMTNASVFSQCPLQEKYTQYKNTLEDLQKQGLIDSQGRVLKTTYLCVYVGDYDSAAWLYQCMPTIWEDKTRGTIPLGWAINPNLSHRFAFGMDYFRKTATANDTFVAGDSGAGYLNPGALAEPRRFSGLPSGVEKWKEHCEKWFDRFDISCVGFIIDGFAPKMTEELFDVYAQLAPDGIGGQKLPSGIGVYKHIMPYITMGSLNSPDDAEAITAGINRSRINFLMLRDILWKPEDQKRFYTSFKKNLDGDAVVLEPYSFFRIMKQYYENGGETFERSAVLGVTLSSSKLTLERGQVKRLKATVFPSTAENKAVTWSSSNTRVATVDQQGRVTSVSPGKTTVTVKTKEGKFKAKCKVTVVDAVVHPESISLSKTGISLEKGKTKTLKAKVLPADTTNKKVVWKSSNGFVASVDENGVVTALSQGSAVITATTADGGLSASCTVKVTIPVIVRVTKVTVGPTQLVIRVGGTQKLKAEVKPSDATNKKIIWSSMNPNVATVDEKGVVTGIKAGTTFIKAKTDDGSKTDTARIIVRK